MKPSPLLRILIILTLTAAALVLIYILGTGRVPEPPSLLDLRLLVENLRATLSSILFVLTIIALARAHWRNDPVKRHTWVGLLVIATCLWLPSIWTLLLVVVFFGYDDFMKRKFSP